MITVLIDFGTVPVDSEAIIISLMTGTISSVASYSIHVGMGSRPQPFVGDSVVILYISLQVIKLKYDCKEEQGGNGKTTLTATLLKNTPSFQQDMRIIPF